MDSYIKNLLKEMGEERIASTDQMRFGEVIARLEELNPQLLIAMKKPHSYRGFYSDLAFEPSNKDLAAYELIAICKRNLNKTLTGYKGGDFKMTENVPVWISLQGSTGEKLMKINDDGSLETEEYEFD